MTTIQTALDEANRLYGEKTEDAATWRKSIRPTIDDQDEIGEEVICLAVEMVGTLDLRCFIQDLLWMVQLPGLSKSLNDAIIRAFTAFGIELDDEDFSFLLQWELKTWPEMGALVIRICSSYSSIEEHGWLEILDELNQYCERRRELGDMEELSNIVRFSQRRLRKLGQRFLERYKGWPFGIGVLCDDLVPSGFVEIEDLVLEYADLRLI